MKRSRLKLVITILVFCISLSSIFGGCSQPVLESVECIGSRDPVKRFYSFHVGNEMIHSTENLGKRKGYLSDQLTNELENKPGSAFDYFTQTTEYPKAFGVGKCVTIDARQTSFDVLLFWRNEDKDVQRLIKVEAINEDSRWLINRVSSAK